MGKRADEYRAWLTRRSNPDAYLKANSGLPGPRANLELLVAVGDVVDAATLWRLSSDDEFLALCGTAGLGRPAADDRERILARLKQLASDPRWRVREGGGARASEDGPGGHAGADHQAGAVGGRECVRPGGWPACASRRC